MKINFNSRRELKDIYKVGNVIKDCDDVLFLVVESSSGGYALVNLTDNIVTATHETLKELADINEDEGDTLVHAEINVF